jgi:hypothetical protein
MLSAGGRIARRRRVDPRESRTCLATTRTVSEPARFEKLTKWRSAIAIRLGCLTFFEANLAPSSDWPARSRNA